MEIRNDQIKIKEKTVSCSDISEVRVKNEQIEFLDSKREILFSVSKDYFSNSEIAPKDFFEKLYNKNENIKFDGSLSGILESEQKRNTEKTLGFWDKMFTKHPVYMYLIMGAFFFNYFIYDFFNFFGLLMYILVSSIVYFGVLFIVNLFIKK